MATSRPQYPYPKVAPGTIRDAYLIATAFEDAARALETQYPLSARLLRGRAHRTVGTMRLTLTAEARQRDARGRWASRSSKSGPRVQPGPAHITIGTGRAAVTDLTHKAICGRTLTGRKITFGPPATGPDDCPPTWTPCRDCITALTTGGENDDVLTDEAIDLALAPAAVA